jgi:hypothetical protein
VFAAVAGVVVILARLSGRPPSSTRRHPPAREPSPLEEQFAPLLRQLSDAMAAVVPEEWADAVLRVEATSHPGGVTGMRYRIWSEGERRDEVGPTAAIAAAARAVWQECEQSGAGWSALMFRMERAGEGWRFTADFE